MSPDEGEDPFRKRQCMTGGLDRGTKRLQSFGKIFRVFISAAYPTKSDSPMVIRCNRTPGVSSRAVPGIIPA